MLGKLKTNNQRAIIWNSIPYHIQNCKHGQLVMIIHDSWNFLHLPAFYTKMFTTNHVVGLQPQLKGHETHLKSPTNTLPI